MDNKIYWNLHLCNTYIVLELVSILMQNTRDSKADGETYLQEVCSNIAKKLYGCNYKIFRGFFVFVLKITFQRLNYSLGCNVAGPMQGRDASWSTCSALYCGGIRTGEQGLPGLLIYLAR